jgi:hypothetical protein
MERAYQKPVAPDVDVLRAAQQNQHYCVRRNVGCLLVLTIKWRSKSQKIKARAPPRLPLRKAKAVVAIPHKHEQMGGRRGLYSTRCTRELLPDRAYIRSRQPTTSSGYNGKQSENNTTVDVYPQASGRCERVFGIPSTSVGWYDTDFVWVYDDIVTHRLGCWDCSRHDLDWSATVKVCLPR